MVNSVDSSKKTLRTRSASPASRQRDGAAPNHRPARQSNRPLSGRSNGSSRPSSGRDKPPTPIGVNNKSRVSNLQKSGRTGSDPNLASTANKYDAKSAFERENFESDSSPDDMLKVSPESDAGYSERVDDDDALESTITGRTNQSERDKSQPGHRIGQSEGGRIVTGQSETAQTGSGLLEPDAFDRLANQIASRVKAEMRHERQEVRMSMGKK